MSGGYCPGGNCPGGGSPDTDGVCECVLEFYVFVHLSLACLKVL